MVTPYPSLDLGVSTAGSHQAGLPLGDCPLARATPVTRVPWQAGRGCSQERWGSLPQAGEQAGLFTAKTWRLSALGVSPGATARAQPGREGQGK